MDDEYILMHGGTEEDIAQIAHGRGACNYAVNGSYCEICKKGKKDNDNIGEKLIGKTIEAVSLSGYEVYLYFTDGSRFKYDASDGGYSTYGFYEKGE